MQARRILEVPLPPGSEPEPDELELLTATFQALVSLRRERGRRWQEPLEALRREGWTVQWGLSWRAEAKRGTDYEEATGATLAEALHGVAQLALADMAAQVP